MNRTIRSIDDHTDNGAGRRVATALAAALAVALLFASTPALAQKCEAGKNQESGKYAFCLGKAEAKLLKTKGLCSVAAMPCYRDEECQGFETCDKDTTKYGDAVAKCDLTYAAKWDDLELKATDAGTACPDGLLQADVKQVIDECIANVASGLVPAQFPGQVSLLHCERLVPVNPAPLPHSV